MSHSRNPTLVRKTEEHDSTHSSAPPSSLEEETSVYFRPLKEDDKDEIRVLHQEWFPVQYKSIFYDSIVSNQMKSSDKAAPPIPLFTCAALIQDYQSIDKTSICGDSLPVKTLPPPPSLSISMCRDEDQGIPSPMEHYHRQQQHQKKEHIWQLGDKKTIRNYNCNDKIIKVTEDTCSNRDDVKVNYEASQQQQIFPKRTEKIIGCIVGSFNSLDNIDSSLSTVLIENPTTHSRVFYIMTLGTATEYRKLGIGSKLVERAMIHAKQDERCGAVYLHVITYNQAAISFYVKLGFVFGK
jgi:ribosomal protein S18 acetylase RimI-like enzyme